MIIFIPGRNWSGKVRMQASPILPDSPPGAKPPGEIGSHAVHRVAARRI
jgi:hypothetical protein